MHTYLMECLGTFYLLLIISLTVNPIAIGLMIMAMTCIGALVSGAHFNGAVSLAFMLHQKLSPHRMVRYMAAQVVGALAALGCFYIITGIPYIPEPMIDMPLLYSMGMEAKLTAVLCMVAMAVASTKVQGYTPAVRGFAIGLTFISIAFVGGLFNPSIAIAIMITSLFQDTGFLTIPNFIVYVAGPLVGGAAASFVHQYFCKNTPRHE